MSLSYRLYVAALAGMAVLVVRPTAAQPTFTLVPTNLPVERGHVTLAPADYDGDGDFDLLGIRRGHEWVDDAMTPALYRNDSLDASGTLVFTEVPARRPSGARGSAQRRRPGRTSAVTNRSPHPGGETPRLTGGARLPLSLSSSTP